MDFEVFRADLEAVLLRSDRAKNLPRHRSV